MFMTELETTLLNIIATHEYNPLNGAKPTTPEESTTFLWVDELAAEMDCTMNCVKGVLSSLVKKELIVITEDPEDNIVTITEKGIGELS